jgi:hypothetical protein
MSDPSLYGTAGESETSAPGGYESSQQDMELALAQLGFGETSEQMGDSFGDTSHSEANQAYVSTSDGSSSSGYFENQDENLLSA